MKEILSIGYDIPSNNEDNYATIGERISLSDADLVVFCPDVENAYYGQNEPPTYHGKPIYDPDSSFH